MALMRSVLQQLRSVYDVKAVCTRAARCFQHVATATTIQTPERLNNSDTGLSALLKPHQRVPKAVFVDAAGTLLEPSEPAARVYLRYASKYGVSLTEDEVLLRYRKAYNTPWGGSKMRFVGDGRFFWQHIVAEATGCDDQDMFEEVYEYYAHGVAWRLMPGAAQALAALQAAGVRLAVVSNFDTRLRTVLKDLDIAKYFDAIIVSAEVGVEKPNPCIFDAACAAVHVAPEDALHIGDDRRNDIWGARDAGLHAWLWGSDITSYQEAVNRILSGQIYM